MKIWTPPPTSTQKVPILNCGLFDFLALTFSTFCDMCYYTGSPYDFSYLFCKFDAFYIFGDSFEVCFCSAKRLGKNKVLTI